jgi:hypothetical protein
MVKQYLEGVSPTNLTLDGEGSGDLSIRGLSNITGYVLNGGVYSMVDLYTLYASGDPPPYFQNPETSAVKTMETKTYSLASSADGLSYDTYAANVIPLFNDTAFADLN